MSSNSKKAVAFFPSVSNLAANPYWPNLASELVKNGVHFMFETPNTFSPRWLLANRKKVQILHIHFCQLFYKHKDNANLLKLLIFAFCLFIAKFMGYRIIFTLHNLFPTYPLEPIWIDKLGHYLTIHMADKIIVHCNNARNLLATTYGRWKSVYVINHPNFGAVYPNKILKSEARNKLGFHEANLTIFSFIGGIRPNKGIENLIKAFMAIKGNNYRLIIAGRVQKPESYAHFLQDISDSDSRIQFNFGYIPNDSIQTFYNASDIIVLPFNQTLTSGSAILAMSFSRPVIAPRIGCLPELIGPDSGWLYEPDNNQSLIDAMRDAAKSDFILIGENARKKVDALTLEKFAKQTINVYWGD